MSTSVTRHWLVVVAATFVGLLVLAPNLWHFTDTRFAGIPVHLNTDEHAYYQHLQETLLGRFGEGGKGIVETLVGEPGLVIVPIEEFYGVLFGWTGVSAAWVFVWLDFLLPFLIFLLCYYFCRQLGFSQKQSLALTLLVCVLQIYNLGRPVQQRASFLLTVITLIGMQHVLRGNTRYYVLVGIGIGLVMATYLWGWMTLWAVWGTLLLQAIAQGVKDKQWVHSKRAAIMGVVGLLFALPTIQRILALQAHPMYEEVMTRSGTRAWRLPESWPWTLSTLAMVVGCTALWWQRGRKPEEALFVAMPLAGWAVFNQQLIHGIEILFRNHVLIYMALTSVLCLAYLWKNIRGELGVLRVLGVLGAALMVAASASEARYYPLQWERSDAQYQEQHLADFLDVANQLPTATILSDPDASQFIVSHSKHYTVYTRYLFQSGFLSNQELAERYCASVLGYPEQQWPEANIFNGKIQLDLAYRQELFNKEAALIASACSTVESLNAEYLRNVGATYILWDEKRSPDWNIWWWDLNVEMAAKGEGWSLWKILSL